MLMNEDTVSIYSYCLGAIYFDNSRNIVEKFNCRRYLEPMKLKQAAAKLEALGNPTRLAVFRVLIESGPKGTPVGEIRNQLDIPASTLSHHISRLIQAGLVAQRRESRTLYCVAEYSNMNELLEFLMQNCCARGCAA
jgi:DNA-binding transcriptional ArsR family regulator